MAVMLTAYVSYFALFFEISVAQLTFEADNRSSRIRAVLTLQFLAFLAWGGYGWIVRKCWPSTNGWRPACVAWRAAAGANARRD